MTMVLYNTLGREKQTFQPSDGKKVKLYTCGPTVYDFAHLGNLRSYIFSDILKRVLLYNGYAVRHIENITDVGHLVSDADEGQDKMMKALAREKLSVSVKSLQGLAKKYARSFFEDIKKLNIVPPDKWTYATRYVPEMVRFIEKIFKAGFAYTTDLAVYFDTSKMDDYTKLTGQKLDEKIVRARANVAEDPHKRHPADFALWFTLEGKNKQHVMHWSSPWGEGFPGWHIECSAMSVQELQTPIDIHTGGIDHISVHHTNERAQNFSVYGREVVRFWMHNEFLVLGEKKMAKSGEHFFTLQSIVDKGFDPLAYRYFCLNTHYRQKLTFSLEGLEAAQNALNRMRDTISEYPSPKIGCAGYEERFLEAINDDLNIPKGIGIAWELIEDAEMPPAAKKQTLLKFDKVFGLGLNAVKKPKILRSIQKLVRERERARNEKNWTLSDQLREKIAALGYDTQDSASGTRIVSRKKKTPVK